LGHPDFSGHDPVGTARQAIVDALRGADLLRDPEGRRMCIEFSEEEIGEPILRTRTGEDDAASDSDALLQLVDELLVCDVAMWVFAYTIGDIYGPGLVAETIHSAVRSHLAAPLLTREERRELHELCDGLVGLDVSQLLKLSVDPGHALRSDPHNLHAVLNELEELPARIRDGLHPITAFVEYLASEQPPESGDRLRAWVDNYVGFRTPLLTAVHSIRDGKQMPHEPEPISCAIQLDADGVDSSRYYLSVHLQEGARPLAPILPPGNTSYTEKETCALIRDALNNRQLAHVHPADLRIEFFLPTSLISLPVDQWPASAAQVALGVKYQVVVRSLTRIQDIMSAHAYWHRKGKTFPGTEFCGSPETGCGTVNENDRLTEEAARSNHDQIFVRLTRDDGLVYLVLAEPPAADRCRALLLALEAGFPVLLWSRRSDADLRGGIGELCANAPAPLRLSDLPRQVLEFRRDAALRGVDDHHLSRHLTLLYDDPEHIPDAGDLLRTLA
jgi:vWA-MoxR associated protein C-terminal domain/vWA-MoxR associated protein middle region 0